MVRVGQNSTGIGEHLTPTDSNPNEFNILNSYFGYNSIYTNRYGFPDIVSNCVSNGSNHSFDTLSQTIHGSYDYPNDVFNPSNEDCTQPMAGFSGRQKGFDKPVYNYDKPMNSFSDGLKFGSSSSINGWAQPVSDINEPTDNLVMSCNYFNGQPNDMSQSLSDRNLFHNYATHSGYESSGMSPGLQSYITGYRRQTRSSPVWNRWSTASEENGSKQLPLLTRRERVPPSEPSEVSRIWFTHYRHRRRLPTVTECVFCRNNNESPEFYKSHILKDPESNIQCPVLRAYDCPICHNGGGPKAHTIRYCPLNRAGIQLKIDRQSNVNTFEYKTFDRKKRYRKRFE